MKNIYFIMAILLTLTVTAIEIKYEPYYCIEGDIPQVINGVWDCSTGTTYANYIYNYINNSLNASGEYLALDGSNANQNINIGSYDIITTGSGAFGYIADSLGNNIIDFTTDLANINIDRHINFNYGLDTYQDSYMFNNLFIYDGSIVWNDGNAFIEADGRGNFMNVDIVENLNLDSGQGYDYGSDLFTVNNMYVDGGNFRIESGTGLDIVDDYPINSLGERLAIFGDIHQNTGYIYFDESAQNAGTIKVAEQTGIYGYEGGSLTLEAGKGVDYLNVAGGTLYLKAGLSTGSTSGDVYIYGAIPEDTYESDHQNTQVPFMSMQSGINTQAIPLLLYRGTTTAYKNNMVSYYYSGASYSSKTSEMRTAFGTPFTLLADNNDFFYIGLQGGYQFGTVYFDLAQGGSGLNMLVSYYDGSTWQDLDGIVNPPLLADTTNNLAQDGYILLPMDIIGNYWQTTSVSGTSAYWIRINTSSITTAPTAFKIGTSNYATPVFRAYTDASTISFYSDWNGYNGINTQAPTALLEVTEPNTADLDGLKISVASGGTTGNANLKLYRSSTLYGNLWYNGGQGDLYLDNSYNNNAGDIFLRTKTSGTALNALSIYGNGSVNAGYNLVTEKDLTSKGIFRVANVSKYLEISDAIGTTYDYRIKTSGNTLFMPSTLYIQDTSFTLSRPSGYTGKISAYGNLQIDSVTEQINVLDNISISENLEVKKNITGNQIYAEMYYHNDTGTAINFASIGVYYTIFFTNYSELNGFNFEGYKSASNLTATISGLYLANYAMVGSGINNHEYHTAIFINEIEQEKCETKNKLTATGDIITMTGTCFINLLMGDKITLRITDKYSTGTGYYYNGNVNLMRIGD